MSLLVRLLCFSLHILYCSCDATEFVFNGFTGANLAVDDSAMVTRDGVLVLTNGTTVMKGHGIYPLLLQFHASHNATGVLSFSTTFVFAILSEYADLSAYGIVFFIAPTKKFSSALPSQQYGLFDIGDSGKASNHMNADFLAEPVPSGVASTANSAS